MRLNGCGALGTAGDVGDAGFGVGSGSEESAGVVEDDADRDGLEQGREASLVEKGLNEGAVL
jgi:hypothetical protein